MKEKIEQLLKECQDNLKEIKKNLDSYDNGIDIHQDFEGLEYDQAFFGGAIWALEKLLKTNEHQNS